MLQCTPAAAATLDQVRMEQGLPETVGLRVFAAHDPDGQPTLGLGFTDGPFDGDQVGEQHGTRLFVAADIAEDLSGMSIDVEDVPGLDGSPVTHIVLRPAVS
jgi:Fe-S cluster assembly iron-binding protein IscA